MLEYSPDYFEKMGIALNSAKSDVNTYNYLSPWEKDREGKLFANVTGITIDLHARNMNYSIGIYPRLDSEN